MAAEGGSYTKEWSATTKTTVTGEPPNSDAPTETARSELRRHDLRFITPYYKTRGSEDANVKSGLTTEAKLETKVLQEPADYKVEKEDESYRLRMIDPKTESLRTDFSASHTLPADVGRLKKATDFPSLHSHRSFVKLNPLERPQRQRLRSLEVRPITPHDYLSESLERHRAMSLSPLRCKLKLDEKSVNEAWNRLPRPERREGRTSRIDREDSYSIAEGVSPYRFPGRRVHSTTSFSDCDLVDNSNVYESYTPAILLLPPGVYGSLGRRPSERGAEPEEQRKKQPHEVLTELVERHRKFYEDRKRTDITGDWSSRNSQRRPDRATPVADMYSSSQSLDHYSTRWYGTTDHGEVNRTLPWRRRPMEPLYEESYIRRNRPSLRMSSACDNETFSRPGSAPLFNDKLSVFPRKCDHDFERYYNSLEYRYEKKNYLRRPSRGDDESVPRRCDHIANSEKGFVGESGFSSNFADNGWRTSTPVQTTIRSDFTRPLDPVEKLSKASQTSYSAWPENEGISKDPAVWHSVSVCSRQTRPLASPGNKWVGANETGKRTATCQEPVKTVNKEFNRQEADGNVSAETMLQEVLPAESRSTDMSDTVEDGTEKKAKTWQRMYPVEPAKDVVKSRVVTGRQVLASDRFLIDMEEKRKNFLVSPPPKPEIQRTGKVWKMPPDEMPVNPLKRKELRVFTPVDDKHYLWRPTVPEPVYKRETKQFTPPSSPIPRSSSELQRERDVSIVNRTRELFEQLKIEKRNLNATDDCRNLNSPREKPTTSADEFDSTVREWTSSRRMSMGSPPGYGLLKSPRVVNDVRRYLAEDITHRPASALEEISSLQSDQHEGSWTGSEKSLPTRSSRPKDMSEMTMIREKLLERAKNRSTVNVNEISKVEAELVPIPSSTKCQSQMNLSSWEMNNAFSPKSVVSINGHADTRGLLRIRTDLSPAPARIYKTNASVQTYDQTVVPLQAVLLPLSAASSLTKEWTRDHRIVHETEGKFSSGDTEETASRQSTLIKIKDEHAKKPKSIMKQKLETKQASHLESRKLKEEAPEITETIEKIEETTTTEEVERRLRGRSKKDRREKHHGRKGEEYPWRSKGGYYDHHQSAQPLVKESYHREVKTKRVHDNPSNGSAHYRSHDYRRRDDPPWADEYGRGSQQFHKSYSSRNVFHNDYADEFNNHPYPIVEFPPTLPRDGDISKRHHLQKTRSLMDWEDQRRGRRPWDDNISELERDFRDSLLMPIPPYGGNMRQREHKEQALPGGYESFSRDVSAQSGTRPADGGRGSGITHFKESKQEMQYKKEHLADRF